MRYTESQSGSKPGPVGKIPEKARPFRDLPGNGDNAFGDQRRGCDPGSSAGAAPGCPQKDARRDLLNSTQTSATRHIQPDAKQLTQHLIAVAIETRVIAVKVVAAVINLALLVAAEND